MDLWTLEGSMAGEDAGGGERRDRAVRHPLGRGASPLVEHRTTANREALGICLRLYYSGDLAKRVNVPTTRTRTRTGASLDDRMVTHLEVASALRELGRERRDLFELVQLVFGEGWSRRQVAEKLRRSPSTVAQQVDEGLNRLIDRIWRDEGE